MIAQKKKKKPNKTNKQTNKSNTNKQNPKGKQSLAVLFYFGKGSTGQSEDGKKSMNNKGHEGCGAKGWGVRGLQKTSRLQSGKVHPEQLRHTGLPQLSHDCFTDVSPQTRVLQLGRKTSRSTAADLQPRA